MKAANNQFLEKSSLKGSQSSNYEQDGNEDRIIDLAEKIKLSLDKISPNEHKNALVSKAVARDSDKPKPKNRGAKDSAPSDKAPRDYGKRLDTQKKSNSPDSSRPAAQTTNNTFTSPSATISSGSPASSTASAPGKSNSSQPMSLVEPPVEEQMLRALECLHYGNRFRDELFIICVQQQSHLNEFALDLRLLHAAEIWVLLLVEPNPGTEQEVKQLAERGLSLTYLSANSLAEHRDLVQEELALGHVPVLPVLSPDAKRSPDPLPFPEAHLWKTASYWAAKLRARRVVLLSSFRGIEVNGKLAHQLTSQEIEKILARGDQTNVGEARLNFFRDENILAGVSMTLVDAKPGRLFLEVFTHRGKGTLISRHHPDQIRRGKLGDVTELSLLMRPSILAGLILPTSDDEIAAHINDYFVYTVNEALVACARLVEYGEAAELAKFSTIPRYQGKGRARDLAREMIEEARRRGKSYVFALSISPKMWLFFQDLGFSEIARENLPEDWKRKYDFSRPSKALRMDLSTNVSQA